MVAFSGYGTTRTVTAVWYGGLLSAEDLGILGFGQVVSLGLLALTFLSIIGIQNGKQCPRIVGIICPMLTTKSEVNNMDTNAVIAISIGRQNMEHDLVVKEGTMVTDGAVAGEQIASDSIENRLRPHNATASNRTKSRHKHLEQMLRIWSRKTPKSLC
jgi:hypothetical protein